MSLYRVVSSTVVADRLRDLFERVRGTNREPQFLAAIKLLAGRLSRAPGRFGESWFPHLDGRLVFRRGSSGPLFVEYAIDEANRVVYLRRFALHGGRR